MVNVHYPQQQNNVVNVHYPQQQNNMVKAHYPQQQNNMVNVDHLSNDLYVLSLLQGENVRTRSSRRLKATRTDLWQLNSCVTNLAHRTTPNISHTCLSVYRDYLCQHYTSLSWVARLTDYRDKVRALSPLAKNSPDFPEIRVSSNSILIPGDLPEAGFLGKTWISLGKLQLSGN
jgi:hypothetical protein